MERRACIILAVAAIALALSLLVLTSGGTVSGIDLSLQRATGGFGLGASASAAWSFFAVDPRLEGYCENELWPIPGGVCYSPIHGAVVNHLPPLERVRHTSSAE